jgi:GNAT superfamily N-acetyltransferase
MRLLAVSAPSAGEGYLSPKFDHFVEAVRVEVRPSDVRRTKSGVAADLTLSEASIAVKYNVYLRNKIVLEFHSTDRSRAELAARLLKLAGVSAELKKKEGGRDEWYVKAATDRLAAGREELRDALAEIVKTARGNDWVDADKAKRWLEKLEGGLTLKEGWPKYYVGLIEGALVVRFGSTNRNSIEWAAQRLREIGLEEGKHFTVKMSKGGKGYVYILKEGLAYAARLSVRGEGERQKLAAKFVEYILQRARDEGEDVYKKALEVVEEGKARDSLTLKGLERKVEVGGVEYVVKVIDGGAEFDVGRSGKKLLRIKITAEVDGVRREYAITFGRYGKDNAALGYAAASAKASGGREADAERLSALVKALTGNEPRIIERSDGTVVVVCGSEHLDGFMRYTELSEAIARWLEETKR